MARRKSKVRGESEMMRVHIMKQHWMIALLIFSTGVLISCSTTVHEETHITINQAGDHEEKNHEKVDAQSNGMEDDQGHINKEYTTAELKELSVNTGAMTANLSNHQYIIISFDILLDNVETKEELEMRKSQVRNMIIKILAQSTVENVEAGEVEVQLKNEINAILDTGQVQRVLTIDRQIQ